MFTSLIGLVVGASCFFQQYPHQSLSALQYFDRHPELQTQLTRHLGEHDAQVAIAVVLPEVSMYTIFEDVVQHRASCLMYIREGRTDFSLGCFQMKPSFAEKIEHTVAASDTLRAKYPLLTGFTGDERTQRKLRLDRLMQPQLQACYLAAFIDIVRQKTKHLPLADDRSLVRHWATLYNAGIDATPSTVARLQTRKNFPRFRSGYSYADVAEDFFIHMNGHSH